MPPYTAPVEESPASLARWWDTTRSDVHEPGVCRHRRKYWARISVRGRWVKLVLCPSEWEANRVSRRARAGEYDKLPAKAIVRLAAALGTTPEALIEQRLQAA
jgi:hypothetical protein